MPSAPAATTIAPATTASPDARVGRIMREP
jgi:hypothetical protein